MADPQFVDKVLLDADGRRIPVKVWSLNGVLGPFMPVNVVVTPAGDVITPVSSQEAIDILAALVDVKASVDALAEVAADETPIGNNTIGRVFISQSAEGESNRVVAHRAPRGFAQAVTSVTVGSAPAIAFASTPAIDLGLGRPRLVEIPENWAASDLYFDVSVDGVGYDELLDFDGSQFAVAAPAGGGVLPLDPRMFDGVQFLKVRSSIAQGSAKTIRIGYEL